MKILITSPSLNESVNVSGISSVVRQIIQRGADDYVHFELGKKDREHSGFVWFLRQISSPIRFLITLIYEKPALVHLNSTLTTKAIVRDAIHGTVAGFYGIPVLLHLHGGRFLLEEIPSRLVKFAAARLLNGANRTVVLSDHEKNLFGEKWNGKSIDVLENAVEIELNFSISDKVKNSIIFLGRLNESKGLDEIIGAFRILSEEKIAFQFRCFGTGPAEKKFVEKMEEILQDRFYFGGIVDGVQARAELRKADIFLLPSRHGEGLPIAMLEAMTAGCIVIASDMASIGTVIEDGHNGYMIEPFNYSQLADRLRHILSDEEASADIRNNARTTVETEHNIQGYTAKLESIYRSVTAEGPR